MGRAGLPAGCVFFVVGACYPSFLVRPPWHVAQPVAMSLSKADICSSLLIEAALTDSCQADSVSCSSGRQLQFFNSDDNY